jgi:hypothetical protein
LRTKKNSFDVMPDLAIRMPRISSRWIWMWRIIYVVRALWRHLRVTTPATWLLGPQYRRSRDMIEIDITYLCNLHCLNCNRSVSQARDEMHMPVAMIQEFVDDSIRRGKRWRRIRVLGGEPTLHPEFGRIIDELRRYKSWHQNCIVEVVSNGYGARVNRELDALPPDVMVDNTAKSSRIQPHFGPFNLAPKDDARYAFSSYTNACVIALDCGMGLTPMGYYPCAVAGGIDRIIGEGLGARMLPDDDDDMLQAADRLCRLCGRFRDGHFVPRALRPALDEEKVSVSWKQLYEKWHDDKTRGVQPVALTVNGQKLKSTSPESKPHDASEAPR